MGGEGIRFPLEVDTMDSIAALGGTEAALESVTAAAERTADATRNAIPIAPAALSAGQSLNVMTGGLRLAGVQTGVLSVAMRAATLSTGLLAGGIKGIGVAFKATLASIPGVGWAILAIAVAVTALMAVLGQNKKALEEQKKAQKEAAEAAKEHEEALRSLNDYIASSAIKILKLQERTREADAKSRDKALDDAILAAAEKYEEQEKKVLDARAKALEGVKQFSDEERRIIVDGMAKIDALERKRDEALAQAQAEHNAQKLADEKRYREETAAFTRTALDAELKTVDDAMKKAIDSAGANANAIAEITQAAEARKDIIRAKYQEKAGADLKSAESELRQASMNERDRALDEAEESYQKKVKAVKDSYAEQLAAGGVSAEERTKLEASTDATLATLLMASVLERAKINKDADKKAEDAKKDTSDRLLKEEKERRTKAVSDASDAAQDAFDVQRESLDAQLEAAQAQQKALREAMPEFKAQFVGIAELGKRIQAAAGGMKAPEEVAAIQKRMEKTQAEIKELDKRAETARKDTIRVLDKIADAKTIATFT